MATVLDGTKVAPHGLFFMENMQGRETESNAPETPLMQTAERGSSCFAWEEEKGESWKGGGATRVVSKEARPTL